MNMGLILVVSLKLAFFATAAVYISETISLTSSGCDAQQQNCNPCSKTLSGCKCLDQWVYKGNTYKGCQNPDNSPLGNWCEYEYGTCASKTPSKQYEFCHPKCETEILVLQSQNAIQTIPCSDKSTCPELIDGQDYFSGDIAPALIVRGAEECQKICGLTNGCIYFAFDKDDKECWLKGNNYENITKDQNVISGRGCI
eukprot:TRINITY_DN12512_c0_g1_i3.p1 TRINITY_DN12512_c0_g1~~TRINITY_DN12512_c0_g1_i3.p1  ORF type:complete len:198 (+),score=14.15 TRINITY_DN12512_c0_g1_i3:98-691(+)